VQYADGQNKEEPNMSRNTGRYTRRGFFKLAGAAGIGSMVAATGNAAGTSDQPGTNGGGIKPVPTRPFGKTGVDVSMLGMGGSQDLLSKPLLLRQAVLMGVTYWDTSESYGRGNSKRLSATISTGIRKTGKRSSL
jgi:hypothetical protein